MSEFVQASRGGPWRRVYATSVLAAAAAYTSGGLKGQARGNRNLPNMYPNSGDLVVLDIAADVGPGGQTPNHIMIKPFGLDAADKTFAIRLWGIEEGIGLVDSTNTPCWEPTLLAEVAVTLGAAVGAAGSLVGASDLYADTLVLTYGIANDNLLMTGATDLNGSWWRSDILGHRYLAIEMDEGVSATAVNALYRFLW